MIYRPMNFKSWSIMSLKSFYINHNVSLVYIQRGSRMSNSDSPSFNANISSRLQDFPDIPNGLRAYIKHGADDDSLIPVYKLTNLYSWSR